MTSILTALLPLLYSAQEQDPPPWKALSDSIDGTAKSIRGWSDSDPEGPIDDAGFLNRLARDLAGRQPTEAEIRALANDAKPGRRSRAIDRFLASGDFAEHWSRRFMDVLFDGPRIPGRNWRWKYDPKAEEKLREQFRVWLRDELKADRSWAEIVSRILRARGSTETEPALAYKLAYFRTKDFPVEFAQGVSQHFLGVRLYCATCHDHPFDQWRVEDAYGLAAFAVRLEASVKGDHVQVSQKATGEMTIRRMPGAYNKNSKVKLAHGGEAPPKFLFGGMAGKNDDRMVLLAKFMTMKANTQFRRAFVNRVFGWIFERGLVHPVDDFNMRNRALSKSMLEVMTRSFMGNGYSLKRLLRGICNSRLYQMKDSKVNPGEKRILRRMIPAVRRKGHAPPLRLEMPESWSLRVPGTYRGGRYAYTVPPREGNGASALLRLSPGGKDEKAPFRSRLRSITGQFQDYKKPKETVLEEGNYQLTDIAGSYPCDDRLDRTVPYRFLLAVVDAQEEPWIVTLEGPRETVDAWRGEFQKLLGSLAPAEEK